MITSGFRNIDSIQFRGRETTDKDGTRSDVRDLTSLMQVDSEVLGEPGAGVVDAVEEVPL